MQRPRNFAPLDLDFLAQDTIAELLDRFGCAGPLTFLELILQAHKQAHAGPRARQGEITLRYCALARTLRLDAERVRAVLEACESLGLLAITREDDEPDRVTARLLKWDRWEAKDVAAATRQAAHRRTAVDRPG
jgi:hypothetical protein